MISIPSLIGRPWRLNASGPEAFDCKGLVCYLLENCFQLEPPPLLKISPTADQKVEKCTGLWRTYKGPHKPSDILVCYGKTGPHVGIFVKYGRLGILHSVQPPGVITGVCFHELEQLQFGGTFGRFSFWRHESVFNK